MGKIETEHHKRFSALSFKDDDTEEFVFVKADITDEDELYLQIEDKGYYVSLSQFLNFFSKEGWDVNP